MSSDDSSSRIPFPKRSTNFVARGGMPQTAPVHRRRRTGSSGPLRERGARRRRTIVHVHKEWVIGGLMLSLVVAAAGGLWLMGRLQEKTGRRTAGEPESRAAATAPVEKWHGPVPSVVADRFIAAKTHEERLQWVRNPAEVDAAMKAFFQSGPGARERIDGLHPLASASSGDLLFESYNVQITGGPCRLLTVSIDPQGAKVDFECYARLGTVPWKDLLSGKVAEADEVRVILQQGGYFLHEFDDEGKWRHFKATSPDLEQTLDFYLDREHPAARDLAEQGRAFRATLSVRAANGSEKHRQFEITAVKSLDWVEPD